MTPYGEDFTKEIDDLVNTFSETRAVVTRLAQDVKGLPARMKEIQNEKEVCSSFEVLLRLFGAPRPLSIVETVLGKLQRS